MAALGLLQDNQKKQAAQKQNQVNAAMGGLRDMGAPGSGPVAAPQQAPGAGMGGAVGLLGKAFGGGDESQKPVGGDESQKPVEPGAVTPQVGPMGGKLLNEEDVYGKLDI